MERARLSSGTVKKAGAARKYFSSAGVLLFWVVVFGPLLLKARVPQALHDAADSLAGGNSWLVLAVVLAPMIYVVFKFGNSEYEVAADIPYPLRILCHFWFLSVRALAMIGVLFPLSFLLALVPAWANFAALGCLLVYSLALLIRQAVRISAAEKTVTTLYDSIKRSDGSVRTRLCTPEALLDLEVLESQFGSVTWYQVTELFEADDHFRYVVRSIRNKVSKFEEVTIAIDGKRVLQVSANRSDT